MHAAVSANDYCSRAEKHRAHSCHDSTSHLQWRGFPASLPIKTGTKQPPSYSRASQVPEYPRALVQWHHGDCPLGDCSPHAALQDVQRSCVSVCVCDLCTLNPATARVAARSVRKGAQSRTGRDVTAEVTTGHSPPLSPSRLRLFRLLFLTVCVPTRHILPWLFGLRSSLPSAGLHNSTHHGPALPSWG